MEIKTTTGVVILLVFCSIGLILFFIAAIAFPPLVILPACLLWWDSAVNGPIWKRK